MEATAEYVLQNIEPQVINGTPTICIDTETTAYPDVTPLEELCGVTYVNNGIRRYIKRGNTYSAQDYPFCISICDGLKSYVVYENLAKLKPILEDETIAKTGHNIKFDLHMLNNINLEVKGKIHDTFVLHKLIYPDALQHSLFECLHLFKNSLREPEERLIAYKNAKHPKNYAEIPRLLMTPYTAADVWNGFFLFKHLIDKNDNPDLYDLEMKVLEVAFEMEKVGICVDLNYKEELEKILTEELEKTKSRIYEITGYKFNISSGQQFAEAMEKIGLDKYIEYTDKGNPSFNSKVMKQIGHLEIIKLLEKYKANSKLLTSFVSQIFDLQQNGILHPSINTMEAKTGRFSISSPSMQNMPKRKDDKIRKAFIPHDGYFFAELDFKSQEAIILAHYSQCERLVNMARKGEDIHVATASIVYNKPPADITKKERTLAKTVGFAITYGAGADKIADLADTDVYNAEQIRLTYLKRLPEINTFIARVNAAAKHNRYVRTILGRKVACDHGREYASINYVIQGSAADSTKTKLALIHDFLKKYKSRIVLQVHDSILYEIHESEAVILPYLVWLQTERDLFDIEVIAEPSISYTNWLEAKDVEIKPEKPKGY